MQETLRSATSHVPRPLLRHGLPEHAFQPGFVYFPEIPLHAVHQHHGDFLRIALTEFRLVVHQLFVPLKSQQGCNPPDGVARVFAKVAVCFGDEEDAGCGHALTVSPSPSPCDVQREGAVE